MFQPAPRISNSQRPSYRVFLLILFYVDSTVPNYYRSFILIRVRAYPYYRTGFRGIATGRKVRRGRRFDIYGKGKVCLFRKEIDGCRRAIACKKSGKQRQKKHRATETKRQRLQHPDDQCFFLAWLLLLPLRDNLLCFLSLFSYAFLGRSVALICIRSCITALHRK